MRKYTLKLGILWVILCLATGMAQVFTATVSGLVTDPSGAGIVGARVKVVNLETSDSREVVTGSDGRYTISQLKPGPYEVTVEAKGFQRFVEKSLTVQASQVAEFNAPLTIGETTQSIEVAATAPVLDTQSADKSVTLSGRPSPTCRLTCVIRSCWCGLQPAW
jgi:hypothetical protein